MEKTYNEFAKPRSHYRVEIPWKKVESLVDKLARMIAQQGKPKAIIAIARGGCIPAVMLSQLWDIRDFHVITAQSYNGNIKADAVKLQIPPDVIDCLALPTTLIVEDIIDTGATYQVLKRIAPAPIFGALISKIRVPGFIAGMYVDPEEWVDFPWEKTNA